MAHIHLVLEFYKGEPVEFDVYDWSGITECDGTTYELVDYMEYIPEQLEEVKEKLMSRLKDGLYDGVILRNGFSVKEARMRLLL